LLRISCTTNARRIEVTAFEHLPAENAKDEVHDEERADDDEADEVDPRPRDAHRVVYLPTHQQQAKITRRFMYLRVRPKRRFVHRTTERGGVGGAMTAQGGAYVGGTATG